MKRVIAALTIVFFSAVFASAGDFGGIGGGFGEPVQPAQVNTHVQFRYDIQATINDCGGGMRCIMVNGDSLPLADERYYRYYDIGDVVDVPVLLYRLAPQDYRLYVNSIYGLY